MTREFYAAGAKQMRQAELRQKSFDIVVFAQESPVESSYLDGFLSELATKTSAKPRIDLIAHNISWMKAYAAATAIVDTSPQAITTIGLLCSQMMRQVLDERKLDIPLFFLDVERPDLFGLQASVQHVHGSTGVSNGQPMALASARMLLFVRPDVRHVVLPFSLTAHGGNLVNAAALIKRFFEDKGVKVSLVPFRATESPVPRTMLFLEAASVVMCFEGCDILDYKEMLLGECKSRNVMVFGGDIEMIKAGAAAGFVLDHRIAGKALAIRLFKHLWHGVPMFLLPNSMLGSNARCLAINQTVATQYGIRFDGPLYKILKNGVIFGTASFDETGIVEGFDIPEREEIDL